MLSSLIFLSIAWGAAGALAEKLPKPEMKPVIPRDQFEADLLDNLPPTPATRDYWGAGWIPQSCKDIANGHNMSQSDFTTFNVHYQDCGEPWVFCRHKQAAVSEADMIDIFGRMPVHMRSYIRHLVATPNLHDGAAAFTYSNGDCVVESRPGLSTLIHETSHSLDWHALEQFSTPFSGTKLWQDSYKQDSHTPTEYGRTNWMEDFAEAGMVGVYDKVVPGGFRSIAKNSYQIIHQYTTYQGYLGGTISPGGTCTKRFNDSVAVQLAETHATQKAGVRPKFHSKFQNITIIVPDKKIEGLVAYTYL